MESTRIDYIKKNIYIPEQAPLKRPTVPDRHPSLILSDKISDSAMTCKHIKENANWLYGPNGEINNPNADCTKTEAYHFHNLIHDSVGRQL